MRRRRATVAIPGEWQCKTARSGKWAQHFSNASCFPSISLAVAKGTLLWQPVKYGRFANVGWSDHYSLFQHSTTDSPIINLLSQD